MTSFFMDIDFSEEGNKKLRFEAPWDFDSSLGNKRFCEDSKGYFAGANSYDVNHEKRGYGNPWFLIFINCDWFMNLARQKWQQIHEQKVCEKLCTYIDFVTNQYEENFKANYSVWDNCGNPMYYGTELCSAALSCRTQKKAASYLKSWLSKRFLSLDNIFLYGKTE